MYQTIWICLYLPLGYKLLKGRDQVCLIHSLSPDTARHLALSKGSKKHLLVDVQIRLWGHTWKLDEQCFPFSLLDLSLGGKKKVPSPNETLPFSDSATTGRWILTFPSSSCFRASLCSTSDWQRGYPGNLVRNFNNWLSFLAMLEDMHKEVESKSLSVFSLHFPISF